LRALFAGQRGGRHRPAIAEDPRGYRPRRRGYRAKLAAVIAGAAAVAGLVVFVLQSSDPAVQAVIPSLPTATPTPHSKTGAYIGVFHRGAPESYAGITAFTKATGVSPRVVSYYSGWMESFQAGFATQAVNHGALPLVQIDPTKISLAAIASGQYDNYLRTYADSVRSFNHKVILGFGHEMNGPWFSWGWRHTRAKVFVAAWRHIVDVFRQQGASNVIWLWTINVDPPNDDAIQNPARWWPGSTYVNWVGIDGYYYKPSWTFAPLFGPTIKIVYSLSRLPIPILISAVGAPKADQPAKIADLFAGIRAYGLLGFVWFDADGNKDWALTTPAAIAAFRRGADAVNDPPP
jgi:mannan endo-1,4-beta-mannosidase